MILSMFSGGAMAQDFEVTSTPFRVDHTLSPDAAWNTYGLNAAIEQRVSYSVTVTTTDACVTLLFLKGHGVPSQAKYFETYSEVACVPSYSNTFPVEAADGTAFTVLIDTESQGDVSYHLAIDILTPVVPAWLPVAFVAACLGIMPALLWVSLKRLKGSKSPPPEPLPDPHESMNGGSTEAHEPPPPLPPGG
jgi:hypothetical protein